MPRNSSVRSAPNNCAPISNLLPTTSEKFVPFHCRSKMNPDALSLAEAARAIRDGSLSPVEYVNALFARIDQVERDVHAWVTVDRDAVLADARRCEAETRSKQFRGPLHGIPIGVKDIFYTKGLRTTMGSPLF